MLNNLPEEMVYHLKGFITNEGVSALMFVNKDMYNYLVAYMIKQWKDRGKKLIDNVNREKLTILPEDILVNEWMFFPINPGAYRTHLSGEMHDHFFLSIDRYIGGRIEYPTWRKAIAQDENGNLMRGMVDYEVILLE